MGRAEEKTTKPKAINPKETVREIMRTLRRKLDPAWVKASSQLIAQNVAELPEFAQAQVVGCYLALPREVQTDALLDACRRAGKRACVPAYRDIHGAYEMAEFKPGDPTKIGRWGLHEPRKPVWIPIEDVDLMITPGLAFDVYGRRLGHGGGHYDRLLEEHPGIKICIAFEGQKMTALPSDPHDVGMDLIVTEQQVYRVPDAYRDERKKRIEQEERRYGPRFGRRIQP